MSILQIVRPKSTTQSDVFSLIDPELHVPLHPSYRRRFVHSLALVTQG